MFCWTGYLTISELLSVGPTKSFEFLFTSLYLCDLTNVTLRPKWSIHLCEKVVHNFHNNGCVHLLCFISSFAATNHVIFATNSTKASRSQLSATLASGKIRKAGFWGARECRSGSLASQEVIVARNTSGHCSFAICACYLWYLGFYLRFFRWRLR